MADPGTPDAQQPASTHLIGLWKTAPPLLRYAAVAMMMPIFFSIIGVICVGGGLIANVALGIPGPIGAVLTFACLGLAIPVTWIIQDAVEQAERKARGSRY